MLYHCSNSNLHSTLTIELGSQTPESIRTEECDVEAAKPHYGYLMVC